MTEHRALEKKQITQGNNRKVQKPSESLKGITNKEFLFTYSRNTLYNTFRKVHSNFITFFS